MSQKRDCPDLEHCFNTPLVISAISIAVGVSMFIGGGLLDSHPVEADELRRLADEYNVAMRRKLAAPAAPFPGPKEPQITFFIAPSLSSSARGLTMGLAF